MTASHDTESDRFMISLDDSRAIAATLSGLADPIRLQILQLLLPGPLCVGDLARNLKLPMVNTSHHLKVMRRAGILEHVKQGRLVMYSVSQKVYKAGTPKLPNGLLKVGFWELHLGKPTTATNVRPAGQASDGGVARSGKVAAAP